MGREEKKMAESEEVKPRLTFSIWPPSQRTRDAVVSHLIGTLSSPSVLSKRYGSVSATEASATARLIEEQSFSAAYASDEAGIDVLQAYSKEISKRVLESIKSKGAPDNAATTIIEQLYSPNNESA